MDRERQRHERSIRARVEEALSEGSKKRDQARDADGVAPVAWVEAIEAARRAESLLGGGDAGARTRSREGFHGGTGRERNAAEAAEKDRRMVERLAAIHNDLGVHNDAAKADADYAAAFRAYGVDPDRMLRKRSARRCGQPGGRGPGQRSRSLGLPPPRPGLAGPCRRTRLIAAARAADPTHGGTGSGTPSGGWGATRPAS